MQELRLDGAHMLPPLRHELAQRARKGAAHGAKGHALARGDVALDDEDGVAQRQQPARVVPSHSRRTRAVDCPAHPRARDTRGTEAGGERGALLHLALQKA